MSKKLTRCATLCPPTDEGLSPKRLVQQQLFDTFKSLLSLIFNLSHSDVCKLKSQYKVANLCTFLPNKEARYFPSLFIFDFPWIFTLTFLISRKFSHWEVVHTTFSLTERRTCTKKFTKYADNQNRITAKVEVYIDSFQPMHF